MGGYIDSLMVDVRFVEDKYPNYDVLGAFLYGSQNYNLDTDDSDVDSVIVLVPSIDSLLCEKEVSTTYELEDHHIVVKDLKAFNKNLLTLSPMAVEPLFAQWKWINGKYKYLWDVYYHQHAQEIALACPAVLYDKVRAMVKSMTRRDFLTGKQYTLCNRLVRFLQQLAKEEDYDDALWIPDAERDFWMDDKLSNKKFSGFTLTELECESTNPTLVKYFTEDETDDREYWRRYLAKAAALMVKTKEIV